MKKIAFDRRWDTIVTVFSAAAWVIVSTLAVQFIVSNLLYAVLGDNFFQPVWTGVYSAIVYVLALALVILVPMKLYKPLRARLGLKGLPTWTDVGLAPIGYVVATALATGLVALFSLLPWFNAGEAQSTGFSIYMSGGERIIAFVALVIVAPIAEEVIFRGWLYGFLREKIHGEVPEIANIIISSLIVSLVFGLVHLQWNVGVNVFCLSMVLCVLREITGTIYSGILVHMIKNGVAFYLLYVLGFGL